MMRLNPAWTSRWWWWALPLAFCVLNGVFLWIHRSSAASGFRELQDDLTAQDTQLQVLRRSHGELEELLATAERNQSGIESLYQHRLASEALRLTDVISEVKGLARRAGLDPPSISYSDVEIEEHGLVQKSIVFGVEGRYAQIREMVNLLELSDHFLILDEIRLRETTGSTLGIDLQVSTLFSTEDADPERSDQEQQS